MKILHIKKTMTMAWLALVMLNSAGAEQKNIALGKTYTCTPAPNAYGHGLEGNPMCKDPDDVRQLTDGELADREWWDPRTVGWWNEHRIDITIDLGREMPVFAVDIHLSSEGWGMRVPAWTGIFTSNDKKSFHLAGEISKAEAMAQWRKRKDRHAWIGKRGMRSKGRYVTFSFAPKNLYLDEIRIFSGNLQADEIVLPAGEMHKSLILYPFYKKRRAYVARDVLTPIHMVLRKEGDPRKGPDIHLDLPPGLKLTAPKPKAAPQTVMTSQDKACSRYALTNLRELYLETTLPAGTVTAIRMTGLPSCKGDEGEEQIVKVEIVEIPPTPLFKKLMANVGFTTFPYYQRWPDVVKNYKRLGLNLFMPFASTDYYYRFLVKSIPAAHAIIREARAAGLIVGGNFSPYCHPSKDPKTGCWEAILLSGRPSGNGCPRAYVKSMKNCPNGGESAQPAAGAKAGVHFFIFDSEPSWPGKICACPVCEKEWKKFLARRAPDLPVLSEQEIWKDKKKNAVYLPLMQAFWDELYKELWGMFREAMQKAAGPDVKLMLGLYHSPSVAKEIMGIWDGMGNKGAFGPLFNAGILDFASPCSYAISTELYGDTKIRPLREALPPHAPMYTWLTAGSSGINFERTPMDVQHRLLEIFFNGGQGFLFWNTRGVDARDYQAIAEVVRWIQPVEAFFLNGRLLPLDAFHAPEGVRVRGLKLGMEAVILVSRYNLEEPGDVEIKLNLPPELLPARIAVPLGGGKPLVFKDRKLSLHFSGKEADFVKIFRLKP